MVPELEVVRMAIEAQGRLKSQKKDLRRHWTAGMPARERMRRQGERVHFAGKERGWAGIIKAFT
jgi:hypothetical protein